MPYKFTDDLAEPMLTGARTALNGGNLHLFAGTVPAGAEDALNLSTTHTRIGTYTVDDDGVTGLTFAAVIGPLLAKNPAEAWGATATFVGFQSAAPNLTPAFWRFCPAGDNGEASTTTGARLQGTAGSDASGADLRFLTTPIPAGTDIGIDTFNVRLGSTG